MSSVGSGALGRREVWSQEGQRQTGPELQAEPSEGPRAAQRNRLCLQRARGKRERAQVQKGRAVVCGGRAQGNILSPPPAKWGASR